MKENSIKQPEKTQDPKLAFFDLDGTLVDGYDYIYQHLWGYFGVGKQQTREVLQQYLRDEITYEEWVKNDVRLLQNAKATKQQILEAISTLRPMEGAVETIGTLQHNNFKVFVISGGIDLVVESVFGAKANDLFEDVFINKYIFDEIGNLIGATPTPYDMQHKATCIQDTAIKYGIKLSDCYFIGDNENDVAAASIAGKSIAFNCKSEMLARIATHTVDSKNLRDILQFMIINS